MCGIAGCYQQPDGDYITGGMSKALAHRGPDAAGSYEKTDERVSVHLAHRRLAIIDLSEAANQPFVKGGLVLSYNGELYNYVALRRELCALGVRFVTSSDTEVVLEAWRRWGPASLLRLRGMFAFALFDEGTGRLVLARDPFGIKPLFYARRGGGVVFASELKAIAATVGTELAVDHGALVSSMLYSWVPETRCVLRGVEKLAPGTWADVRPDGSITGHTYFDVGAVAAEAAAGPPADLRRVIQESVAVHLEADVPVSTFLSGGLDSSMVTVLARRANPDLEAYTISFRAADQQLEAMPDDAHYARRLARRYGIPLNEIEIAPDIVDLLPRMAASLDEPIGDPAGINTLLISEAARRAGVKVLLSGMGADELFGGYRRHLANTMIARYDGLPAGLRTRAVEPLVARVPVAVGNRAFRTGRWAKRFLSFSGLSEEAAYRRSYTLYSPEDLAGLIDPDLGTAVQDVVAEHAHVYNDNRLGDHVNRMCLADARLFLPSLNLAYTDRASMAASTEVRVPFVDVEVFKAAFSLRGSDKVRRLTTKAALKHAAEVWLPREIVHRPKGHFSAPLRAWIRNDLRPEVDGLMEGELVRSGFLRTGALADLVMEDRLGRQDRAKQLWQLLTLEMWLGQARALGIGT